MKTCDKFEGRTFGAVTLRERGDAAPNGATRYKGLCQCGTERLFRIDHLKAAAFPSCGCIHRKKPDARLRKDIECEACRRTFTAKIAKGVWPKFCSRECWKISASINHTSRQVHKKCAQCGVSFDVGPDRKDSALFCSRKCHVVAYAAQTRESECEYCGRPFISKMRHDGVFPKFCDAACYMGSIRRPEDASISRECAGCAEVFDARWIGRFGDDHADPYAQYCSQKCRNKGRERGEDRKCSQCGAQFYLRATPAKNRSTPEHACCSWECRKEFFKGVQHPDWKGFYMDAASGFKKVNMPRPNRASPFISEHRIVAARAIGRLLEHSEPIIHINRVPDDNAAENLFICKNKSELAKRYSGSLTWPAAGNLDTYK